ncbi:MAG: chromosome segregation protein SMC [Oscillospiraceae bacterium]|nr:chromosome segregation protein SMC [Oscillospiraceae bacterium]
MYLKAIELHGFKSFPDKTRVSFDKGMTAVIGPNGSGKSNISDAIRWVLGETSGKELRSAGKMEDIIFGGTSQRGPMGFASVSLILDNSDRSFDMDSDEVSVTRKYYRGGDGEYFINGNRVRLKDIYELFLDTGLGKSGYSIVGQGKISQIVTAKPENRREIFEEASGISKFRYKKNEAEKKLSAAQENIIRLTDNLRNLEERVGPLERESKKAKEFVALSDKKKGMEISLWLSTINRSKSLIRDQQRRAEIFRSDRDNVENSIAEKEAYVEKRYFEGNELIRKGEENQNTIRDIEQQISAVNSDRAVAENQIQYDSQKLNELEKELRLYESLEGEADSKKQQLEAEIADLESRKTVLAEKETETGEQLALLGRQAVEADSRKGTLLSRETLLTGKIQESKIEIHGFTTQNASVMETANKAKQDLISARGYLETTQAQIAELTAFSDEAQRKIIQNTNIKNGLGMKLSSISGKMDNYLSLQNENTKKQIDTQNRIKLLTDMENNMEGFQHSVKTVLNMGKNGSLKGIIGTIAQLITVEKGYETAIEIALGNYGLQNIVVENETCAKYAIEYLKNNRAGRATFLPLDTVKPSHFSENLPEWATTADRIVNADAKYSHIISNLLGRTIITEDINSASRLAKQLGYRYKIVTTDGQQINAGGSFTGGSVSKSAGLFTRKGEIEKLKITLANLRAEFDKTEKEKAEVQNSIDLINSQIDGCNAEIDALQSDKNQCSIELAKYQQQENQYRDSIYLYEGIVENGENVVKANREKENALYRAITECEKELAEVTAQLSALGETDAEYAQKKDALMGTLQQIKVDIVTIGGEITVAQNNLAQLSAQSAQSEARKAQIVQDMEEIRSTIAQKQVELGQKAQSILDMQQRIKDIEQQNRDFVALRFEIEKERNEIQNEVKTLRDELMSLSEQIAKIDEKIGNMEKEYDDIIQKLWEEYELTVQTAREFAFDFEDENQLKKDLAAIKASIKRLGHVNVGAIEEYREVYEKYTFLKEQLRDLEESRNQLQKLITSLNGEMKTMFSESFGIINQNFGKIFRQLFGGGSAKLILTDPENILESGVDISVNPPGKVIKSLTALSGGEQALVAISIYFAILAHNPSPFCILDEIEAALDDANVTRYANYLHDISDTTQFIVITHRRGTMESADVLYGVTMQEDGISKLLKLDVNNVSPSLIN